MLKLKILFVATLFFFLFFSQAFAQKEMSKPKSSYEKFLSDVGTMITKDFIAMPVLSSSYQNLEVKIINVTSGKANKKFLSFSAKAKYGDKSAVISYQDLLEIKKALVQIIKKAEIEKSHYLEYRERYFATDDGFKLGYFQQGTEQTFFLELANYQSDDTFFFNNLDTLLLKIKESLVKMDKLK